MWNFASFSDFSKRFVDEPFYDHFCQKNVAFFIHQEEWNWPDQTIDNQKIVETWVTFAKIEMTVHVQIRPYCFLITGGNIESSLNLFRHCLTTRAKHLHRNHLLLPHQNRSFKHFIVSHLSLSLRTTRGIFRAVKCCVIEYSTEYVPRYRLDTIEYYSCGDRHNSSSMGQSKANRIFCAVHIHFRIRWFWQMDFCYAKTLCLVRCVFSQSMVGQSRKFVTPN